MAYPHAYATHAHPMNVTHDAHRTGADTDILPLHRRDANGFIPHTRRAGHQTSPLPVCCDNRQQTVDRKSLSCSNRYAIM